MLCIDKDLFETKKERVTKKYDALENLKVQHIRIARKEYEQKNVESGSKEKQDFLDEIHSLKEIIKQRDESLTQITTSSKNSIDQLNSSLELANSLITDGEKRERERELMIDILEKDLKESKRSPYFAKEVSKALQRLNIEDAQKFVDLEEEENGRLVFRTNVNRKEYLQRFWTLNLVEKISDNHYIFNDLGSVVYNTLHIDNELSRGKNREIEKEKFRKHADMLLKDWKIETILSIRTDSNGIVNEESINPVLLQGLQSIGVFTRNANKQLMITNHGKDFLNHLKEYL